MTTIPINAVGQEANLNFIPRFDENRFPMIPRRPLNIKPPIQCKDNSNSDSLPGRTHREFRGNSWPTEMTLMTESALGGCRGALVSRLNGKPQPHRLGYSNQRREPWIPFGRERAVEALPLNAGLFRNFGHPAS
jgi:hypothetical protein